MTVILLAIFLTACGREDSFYNISKRVFEAGSYSATADITITGNKGISRYKVKQLYAEPDKLRIDTLEPAFLKGKIIVLYDNRWKMYHPLVNSSFQIQKPMDDDELILMGIVQKSVFTNENSKIYSTDHKGIKCVAIRSIIPGGNRFRNHAVLYINRETRLPQAMEIYDDKGNITVDIVYSDFKYGIELKDSMFKL
jgi:outer membrane lipoprotein-sorting protein